MNGEDNCTRQLDEDGFASDGPRGHDGQVVTCWFQSEVATIPSGPFQMTMDLVDDDDGVFFTGSGRKTRCAPRPVNEEEVRRNPQCLEMQ